MHYYTKKLIEQVNSALDNRSLIYFARDAERGLGLEKYINNYYIAAIEDGYIVDQLGQKAFSLMKNIQVGTSSTLELVSNAKTIEWVKTITQSQPFFAQLFQFSQPAVHKLEALGGSVLNNSANLNRKFEDKLSQVKVFSAKGIKFPEYEVVTLKEQTYEEVSELMGDENFVVQINRAHTGSGTFFIKDSIDWDSVINSYSGNEVKISKFVDGDSYTINGCVTKKGIYIAGLQYQITGIPELTHGLGSTVGNDFSFANNLSDNVRTDIFQLAKKVGEVMSEGGFRGLFGIDVLVENESVYLVEVNARQTANISLQTKLEILNEKIPLSLINLAEWLNIDLEFEPFKEIEKLEGSQVFLRSRVDGFKVSEQLKSGVYRLQSDNAALLMPDSLVINIDEEKDKPLIWQRDGYSVEDINQDGFILIAQKLDTIKNSFDEVARLQFDKGVILSQNGRTIVTPWVIEAMQEILQRVS